VIILNSSILAIRPKSHLAETGNYRESRWFTAWYEDKADINAKWFKLPNFITQITSQTIVPFSHNLVLEIDSNQIFDDLGSISSIKIGFEMCEELWRSNASNIKLFGEKGVDIIVNSSGSYWEIRKLDRVLNLMKSVTLKSGGIYAFSNLIGCDGGRLCYYGRSNVVLNGEIIAKTTTPSTLFHEIELAVASFCLSDIINYRLQNNIKTASHKNASNILIVQADNPAKIRVNLSQASSDVTVLIENFSFTSSIKSTYLQGDFKLPSPQEEIMMYGSLWLWDYLRRCPTMKGFIVPLSGGLDSSSVACLVYSLSILLFNHLQFSNLEKHFINSLQKICGLKEKNLKEIIKRPQDICSHLLLCCYLKTKYSSEDSGRRAQQLSDLIGAQFVNYDFTSIYENIDDSLKTLLRQLDSSFVQTDHVTLLQQNLQARLRMVLTYYLSNSKRLVLATGNVDESLVGYLTKYDCSSADLNPIGSISKEDLKQFLAFIKLNYLSDESNKTGSALIDDILNAIPSAELTGESQADEKDIGLTYQDLSLFGRLRRGEYGCCGPFKLFCKLWDDKEKFKQPSDPVKLANKVKRFFILHARNRHKQTVLTPCLHTVSYSPDDNRFDHRQFLFNTNWTHQFECIDEMVKKLLKSND